MSIDHLQRELAYQYVFSRLEEECKKVGWLRPTKTQDYVIHLQPLIRKKNSPSRASMRIAVHEFLVKDCGFAKGWGDGPLVIYKNITYHHPTWSK